MKKNVLLPQHVREALRRAAQTPVTPADPLARVRAIEAAIERARRSYPEFFKKESPNG